MRVTALATHGPLRAAVRAALTARGWDPERSRFAAAGLSQLALLLEDIDEAVREALVRWSARSGVDVLTGDGWALVVGVASRLAVLARPDRAPPELHPIVADVAQWFAEYAEPPRHWSIAGGELSLDEPVLIGIVNVTPDSFSDGGRFTHRDAALDHAAKLKADGCQLLDVGGESTRPGATPVTASDEIARVVPVIEAMVARGLGPVSVDTRKAVVARRALDAGAAVVNDVSGLSFDAELGAVVAASGAGVILMHMRGTPDTMDSLACYEHVAVDVARELRASVDRAEAAGVSVDHIVLDPGFGFAKTAAQNFQLLDELATITGLGLPVLVGPSRKRFLGAATGRAVEDRDRATAVACALAWERGARLFRVHDPGPAREALAVARALEGADS
ncbi:MAG TPA: dihydropteroate synthase [Gemmatimonadales bacterium]|nr:dihydropteroate synthase [Gemmatimonadales bacterium]